MNWVESTEQGSCDFEATCPTTRPWFPRICNAMLAIMPSIAVVLRMSSKMTSCQGSAMGVSRNFDNLFVAKLNLVRIHHFLSRFRA
jgi:hypothetical protein